MKKISKKWREWPIEDRLLVPEKYFDIPKKEVERIRQIKNPKERLMAAAKLQCSLFGDLHSLLTVWLAGFASDISVRQYFGSTQRLRDLFIKPQKRNLNLSYSLADIKRKITIPTKITGDVAEEVGIHIGDGNLNMCKDKNGFFAYRYSISGDLRDELLYHTQHIAPLIKKIYNLDPRFLRRENKNNIDTRYASRAVIDFKNKVLGLPIGPKKDIEIPEVIMKDNELSKRCVCGILDTDFHITSSFSISGKIHGLKVVKQIHEILDRNKIKHVFRLYSDYGRFYIPQKESRIIVFKWKMNNPKHLTKFEVFDRFHVYLPFTSTLERINLLNGKISLQDLMAISEERRNITTPRGLEPRTS